MDSTAIDLEALVAAMKAAIAAKFPAIKTVGALDIFDVKPEGLKTPALLFQIDNGIERDDTGTEQIDTDFKFAFYIVFSAMRADGRNPDLCCLASAATLAAWLKGHHFAGMPARRAKGFSIYPDQFAGDAAKAFKVWRVECTIGALIGESVFFEESPVPPPQTVLTSTTPLIGLPHQGDYQPLTPPNAS